VSVVIDASATLALLFEATGSDVVERMARGSLLSAVNLDEVLHKGARNHLPFDITLALLTKPEAIVVPFDAEQAQVAAALHSRLHRLNISFGDRACFALATVTGSSVLTADRDWSALGLDLDIVQIR